MRVWTNPTRMNALGLTVDDLSAAIQAQNIQASLGQVGAQPAPEGTAVQYSLVAQGRLKVRRPRLSRPLPWARWCSPAARGSMAGQRLDYVRYETEAGRRQALAATRDAISTDDVRLSRLGDSLQASERIR